MYAGPSSGATPHSIPPPARRTSKLYVRPSKLTFMTAGALAPHCGVRVSFQSGSRVSQNSQWVSLLQQGKATDGRGGRGGEGRVMDGGAPVKSSPASGHAVWL